MHTIGSAVLARLLTRWNTFMRSTCVSVLALTLLTCCGHAQMMPGQPAWVTPAPIPADGKFYQAESTRVMAALLKKIYSETDPVFDPTKQAKRSQPSPPAYRHWRSAEVEKLEITWPTSHMVQSFTDIPADQTVFLREGDKSLVRIRKQ